MADYRMTEHIGLEGATVKRLNEMAMDLLLHPNQSVARGPALEGNVRWLEEVRRVWAQEHPENPNAKESMGNPCPPGSLFGRLEALWRAGSTVTAEEALARCAFRRDIATARAIFEAYPDADANPRSSVGTPILMRLAYQGPDDLFELFLRKGMEQNPQVLDARDEQGRGVMHWALRNKAKGRAAAVMVAKIPGLNPKAAKAAAAAMVDELAEAGYARYDATLNRLAEMEDELRSVAEVEALASRKAAPKAPRRG